MNDSSLEVSRVLSGKRYFGKQVVVAIDGKVLRGTLNEKQEGVYLLAAYLPGEGIVLMEVSIKGKGQEIEAAPQVLKSIDLRDKVVIGDALHTQRAVSIQIVEAGGEYVWFVKGNQPQVEENLRLWFGPDPDPIPGQSYLPKDFETAQSVNKGHGRIEQRTLTVSSQLNDFLDWPYQEQVFKLEQRFIFPKTGEVQEQVVYGITSLTQEEVSPQKLLQMTRSYWGIENGLHYRRDVTLPRRSYPHDPQKRCSAICEKAIAVSSLGNQQEALALFDQALEHDPTNPKILFSKGIALSRLEKYVEATETFELALSHEPDNAPGYYYLGVAYAGSDQYEEAINAFDHSLALDPVNATAHYFKGIALVELEHYDQALIAFNQALAIDPAHALSSYYSGIVYLHMQNFPEAIAAFDQALLLDAGMTDAPRATIG